MSEQLSERPKLLEVVDLVGVALERDGEGLVADGHDLALEDAGELVSLLAERGGDGLRARGQRIGNEAAGGLEQGAEFGGPLAQRRAHGGGAGGQGVGEHAGALVERGADGVETVEEMSTTCCYAEQDKVWVFDPAGAPWEVYTVTNDNPEVATRSGACLPLVNAGSANAGSASGCC